MYIRLLGLTDSFYDEIKSLPLETGETGDQMAGIGSGMGRLKKCKVNPVKFIERTRSLYLSDYGKIYSCRGWFAVCYTCWAIFLNLIDCCFCYEFLTVP